ncbi:hypothetical protein HYDPIDRAFT_99447 [Hydnomerulius pinastri MD-312]|uniref:Porphobilinogen deaminase n=1 Tax=Hydnomerulius pinastri MD-312 TaxID=994086 RepID=A0A0C9WAF6_9AGAM|nr:hypothetical protein HYDPIDRAFT_99447 [Hydnomerulius pinastri MD-312]
MASEASGNTTGTSDSKSTTFVLGSRKSELAKIQTNIVVDHLKKKFPPYNFETKFNETEGDKNQSQALFLLGGKALWTRGLEELLASGEVDMLVHSLKDVPTKLDDQFMIGAILEREDSVDSLVMKESLLNTYTTLDKLPKGSRIGTSSVRRVAQLKHRFKDLVFKDVRGNLNTRLRKLDATGLDDAYDALILAKAGLVRLGWSNRATEDLGPPHFYHAVSQGALAVEIRSKDASRLSELCEALTHQKTQWMCLAERAMLEELEGGCSVPVGVHTELTDVKEGEEILKSGERKLTGAELKITGCVTSLDGTTQIVKWLKEPVDSAEAARGLGQKLGVDLKSSGADKILQEIQADREKRAGEARSEEEKAKIEAAIGTPSS